jgi:hypothetical protein
LREDFGPLKGKESHNKSQKSPKPFDFYMNYRFNAKVDLVILILNPTWVFKDLINDFIAY